MSSSFNNACLENSNINGLLLADTCNNESHVNLPLEKELLPLQEEKEKEKVRDQVICMIFDLHISTEFYKDFSCAIASTLAMHGRMYPTSSHVCFYSNMFGRERKILIPYESIYAIEKTTTMMFQHSIRLATFDKNEYTFTSFWGNNRDSCYELIVSTRDRVLRELPRTVVDALEPRHPALPTSSIAWISKSLDATLLQTQSESLTEKDLEEEKKVGDKSTSDHTDYAGIATRDDTKMATDDADSNSHTNLAFPHQCRVVSDVDSIAPKDISMIQVLKEVFPVSTDTFMEIFYVDNAPFGLDKFGERTGSSEMTMNPWVTPVDDDKLFGSTRSMQFRVPIDAPIGPKSSRVDVLQCLKESENGVRVVESSTRLVDIPYGDYFSVEDRWTIVPHPSYPNSCKLFIELKVAFGKSTFWKKTIEARAISDNRAKWENWAEMAKEFLGSRNLNDAANCAVENSPTPSTLLAKTAPDEVARKDHGSVVSRRCPTKPRHLHGYSTTAAGGACAATVRVFPWVLVLLLLLVVLRLQMTLSSIERSLLDNAKLISNLERQLSSLEVEGYQ
ncbi:unnamed protein product [Peronospora belbahrii]|uniref:VASt domain-containing protein n=1 Tax=Peronospora belbahrii TaxID=622444 RepID=A0AAU9KX42_9STRA|nr:unnamed protein product [Peronospora belbahrii]CAH0513709.1 unnamed protein product [Peronospora belbahrii]